MIPIFLHVPDTELNQLSMMMPAAHAANANLFVSAENSQFDNYMSGPQVIEVVVIDSDIDSTTKPEGEPDVTINGKYLRMVQAVDGNWYGYFADRKMAQIADATATIGVGLDFGTFCDNNSVGLQGPGGLIFGVPQTVGVAVPGDVIGGVQGIVNIEGSTTCSAVAANTLGTTDINVLREEIQINTIVINDGQINVDVDAWPFIQLYDLNPTGSVIVQYNKGGGVQNSTLTFDTVDQFAKLSLDKAAYTIGSDIKVTITDPWLNIDPTDEDSWTFGTVGTLSSNYQVFDENGLAPGDLPVNIGALNPSNLGTLMCEDNCVLQVNPDVQNKPGDVITLQDNADTILTDGAANNSQNPLAWMTGSGFLAGNIPITVIEQGSNSGIFGSYDESDASSISITTNATSGTSASFDYSGLTKFLEVYPLDMYELKLDSGFFTPEDEFKIPEIISASSESEKIFFLQTFYYLDPDEIEELENEGITLIDFLNGFVYIASANSTSLQQFQSNSHPEIRSMIPIEPQTKIDSNVKSGIKFPWVYSEDDKTVFSIFFHDQVSWKKIMQILLSLQAEIGPKYEGINSVNVFMKNDQIEDLAEYSAVKFISYPDAPLYVEVFKAKSSGNIPQINTINPNLTGENIVALIFEESPIDDSHVNFNGRVSQTNDPPNNETGETAHATHVAGILGGGGEINQRGIAPDVKILSWGSTSNGPINDPTKWALSPGDLPLALEKSSSVVLQKTGEDRIDLMNISLGQAVNEAQLPCKFHGDYKETSQTLDKFVQGYNGLNPIIITKSAGNDGNNPNGCQGGHDYPAPFGTLTSPASAKNPIVVGSIDSDTNTISSFSSFGPTDDGRIKPDLVAPGAHNNEDGLISTGMSDSYFAMTGTSAAAPFVGGLVALMKEQWENQGRNPDSFSPHTAKAILIHTAKDLEPLGPDYNSGWGLVDGTKAIKLIADSEFIDITNNQNLTITHDMVIKDSLRSPNSLEKRYLLELNDPSNVTVTLVWDDFPSSPGAASKEIMNDLDVRINKNTQTIYPFLLDKNNPVDEAKRGDDDLNNVEMIKAEQQDGILEIIVKKEQFFFSPQEFTLIVSMEPVEYNIELSPNPPEIIDEGQSLNFHARVIPESSGVTYLLEDQPNGASLESDTGTFSWTPNNSQGRPSPYSFPIKAMKDGIELDKETININVRDSGCLIATAAYGSEMAPQVQFLREIRDNKLMNTQSGASFMSGFNQIYYSFSPYVAAYERENPVFKEAVKIAITPLLASLSILSVADSEQEVLGLGIGVILINIGMYFVFPIFAMIKIKKYFDK
jgi:hypothetical protein